MPYHSVKFKYWLNEEEQTAPTPVVTNKNIDWTHPDTFFRRDRAIPFIFAGNKLYTEPWSDSSHYDMLSNTPELQQRYGLVRKDGKMLSGMLKFINDDQKEVSRDVILDFGDLLGRIGKKTTVSAIISIVSFWNKNQQDYANLTNCLNQMKQNHLIDDTSYISTPIHGTVPVTNIQNPQAITPEMAKKVDLYRQLHLMRGQEKHDTMKELGLGGAMKKSPMPPGVKWWSPLGENYEI